MTITINRLPGYGEPIVLDVETLVGADLRGSVLYGAALSGAVLTRANLIRANLYGAHLIRADLYGADLTRANLSDVDLTGVYMTGGSLRGANLTRANLTRAYLRGTDLTNANLRGATIHNDTISSLLTRAGRSDGFEFIAFKLADGSTKIMAGCRWMTPEEYRAHVAAEYPNTDKARETLDIIEFIERRATA